MREYLSTMDRGSGFTILYKSGRFGINECWVKLQATPSSAGLLQTNVL
jgi:hypothetical protein